MAENYDDIDKKTPDTVDTDGHASDDKDNDDDYEKYCYLCRRPESVAGKLIHMPGDKHMLHLDVAQGQPLTDRHGKCIH
jgi:ATP-dependent Clp protease ATP-binding subunit ClpX